jgi:hypothetical protein
VSTQTITVPEDEVLQARKSVSRTNVLLFALTSLLSAFLLFQVQLIVSKHILPWFGGSAAVWTTSMLVFQLLLLGGYVYSHLISMKLSARTQTIVHLALLAAAFLTIVVLSLVWSSAIMPGNKWRPDVSASPAASVAAIILVSAGLPFFVLSTTGPLLQSWFGRLGGGVKAYRLYSVSNIGSLLGLLTFPFLFEPTLRLKVQAQIWSAAFCLFAIACCACAWSTFQKQAAAQGCKETFLRAPERVPARGTFALWFLLAACASALLLAITNFLCQEVITVPLLWVFPLGIYLLSFILCFDRPRWYQRAIFHPLFALSLFATCAALVYEKSFALLFALPLALFVGCMICHGELVKLKPGINQLTSFYLAVSAGGAAGGIFVALVAPRIFSSFIELQLSIGLTLLLSLLALLWDSRSWIFRNEWWLPTSVVGLALAAGFAATRWIPDCGKALDKLRFFPLVVLLGVVTVMGAVVLRDSVNLARRGFRFVQILIAVIAIAGVACLYLSARPKPEQRLSMRSFYGVVQVLQKPGIKEMVHGQTTHGGQLDPPLQRMPIMYYGPKSGIGTVLLNHPGRFTGPGLRIGVVGLGTGTIATYGRPGDYISYYEINPDVVRLAAGDQPKFTYIRDSAAPVEVKVGDARLVMERELSDGHSQQFDVLILDAFNGDAVPVHLLTKEAFDTYWKHLNPQTGVIAIHITSRHVNLVPVLEGAADHLHAPYALTYNPREGSVLESVWFVMARNPETLKMNGLAQITVQYVHKVGPRLWTDDYSDIFRLLY